jgi:hypothetical protein
MKGLINMIPRNMGKDNYLSKYAPSRLYAVGLVSLLALTISGPGFLMKPAFARPTLYEVEVPLIWIGRSVEAAGSVPSGNTAGGMVSAGLALPLGPNQIVFDNGSATPQLNKASVPPGTRWASYPQYNSNCYASCEVRHIQAKFTLPAGVGNISDLILFSPYYAGQGNIIPLNDNLYVFLNGHLIGQKGRSYGSVNGGTGGTSAIANETDGWYQDGSFGTAAASALQVGPNTIDLVLEEECAFGGLGLLKLKLITDRPQADPIDVYGCSVSQTTLWPPNHKYVDVTVNYNVTGGTAPISCELNVTSNEPIDGLGDGDKSPDWIIVDAHHVKLRAERSGIGRGRIYTIRISCTDANGVVGRCDAAVEVPHDQR